MTPIPQPLTAGIALLLALLPFVSACTTNETRPFENAGRRGDEIVDNVKKGKAPLHKNGPLERAGDAIDDSLENK